jgi:hypothetical protein
VRSKLRARSEHAMEARERVPRRWHESAKPRDALHGGHDPTARRAPRRLLHAVGDATVAQDAKARKRKGRTKAVAAKPLSAEQSPTLAVSVLLARREAELPRT